MQSKQLTEFYREYSIWLGDDAPQHRPFDRAAGLCYNIWIFTEKGNTLTTALKGEMRDQFMDAGLDIDMPFNEDADDIEDEHSYTYEDECDTATCHLNPKRIQWIQEHVDG